jgi:hypothetical protein
VLAVAVALAVLAACSSGAGSTSPPGPRGKPSDSATTPGPGSDDKELVEALTQAGVRITGDGEATVHAAVTPASGTELTLQQVEIMWEQARDSSGMRGSLLDDQARPRAEIPLSALLAGYARGVQTPGARLAAKVLAPQDLSHPQQVVFPALVLTLFASDAAHAMAAPAGASNAVYSPSHLAASGGGLCSQVTDGIYKGINTLFDALRVKRVDLPKTGVAFIDGILQGIANVVVDGVNVLVEAGRTLVIGIYRYTLDQVLSIIAKVAALAAMIGEFVTAIGPLHVKVVADPDTAPKSVAGSAAVHVAATATASIDLGLGVLEWPEWFEDCARVAKAPLPPLKPVGDPVTWTIDQGSAADLLRESGVPDSKDLVLVDGGPGKAVGKLDLVTGTEDVSATGQAVSSDVRIIADVQRQQVTHLRDVLVQAAAGLLTSGLPAFIRKYLDSALVGIGTAATDGLVKLLNGSGTGFVTVTYHEEGRTKPPSAPPPASRQAWQGTWSSAKYPISGSFRLDVTLAATSMAGTLQVAGSDCISAGELRSKISGSTVEFGLVAGGRALITFRGTVTGTRMSGTYTSGPDCGNDKGSWQATRAR